MGSWCSNCPQIRKQLTKSHGETTTDEIYAILAGSWLVVAYWMVPDWFLGGILLSPIAGSWLVPVGYLVAGWFLIGS